MRVPVEGGRPKLKQNACDIESKKGKTSKW